MGELPRALADCEESLEAYRNPDSLFITAFIHDKLDAPDQAIALLQEAVARNDAEARSFLLLSQIVARKGDHELAINIVKDGLQKYPKDELLIDEQAKLAK